MEKDDKITITMTIPVSDLPRLARLFGQRETGNAKKVEKGRTPPAINKESLESAFHKHHLIINGFRLGRLTATLDLPARREELQRNRGFYVRAAGIAQNLYGKRGGFKLLPNSWLAGCIAAACPDGSDRAFSDAEKFFRETLSGKSDFCALNALHKELMDDYDERTKGRTYSNRVNVKLDTIKKIFKALSIYKARDKYSALLANRLDGVTLP